MKLKSLLGFLIANKSLLLIGLISFVLCIFNIYGYPIYILDEAKNTEAAREMLTGGNFIVPTFNNVLRTDKPPLHYFFMMLGYKVFGVNALGARFFSSIVGTLTFLTTYFFVKRLQSKPIALLTVAIMASAVFFVQEFHLAVPDPYLIFFINAALFCFYSYYKSKRNLVLFLGYVCIAFGFLAKGPIAIAIVGASVFLFLLLQRKVTLKTIFSFKPILGLLLVAVLVFPWFYSVHVATNGAWTEGFFIGHNVNRFGNKMEGHGGPFVITWLFVLLGLLPFSFFIVQSFFFGFKNYKHNSYLAFALSVCIVVIGFFSISGTKLPNYTMPCYPVLASLIASYFYDFYERFSERRKKYITISFIVLLVVACLMPIAAFIALSLEKELEVVKYYGLLLGILPVGMLLAYRYYRKNDFYNSFAVTSATWILLSLVLFGVIYPKLMRQNPVYKAQQLLAIEVPVIVYKRMDSAFPINFRRTYEVVKNIEELQQLLAANTKLYIITNDRHAKEELNTLAGTQLILESKALFENHKTLIYSKQ